MEPLFRASRLRMTRAGAMEALLMKRTLLIADDEKNTRIGLKAALEMSLGKKNIEIKLAADGEEALQIIRDEPIAVVITDLKMPKADGHAVLTEAKKASPFTEVIILTGHGTIENAVDAMKDGAKDYLIKPINLDELAMKVKRVLGEMETVEENEALREQVDRKFHFDSIIGQSEPMRKVFAQIRKIAPSRANVFIRGETGTGKELVATAIHNHSPRRRKPFIKVNCGAYSETLLESEIFGHEKGAFTHAIRQKPGIFERADGGTVFLDEIAETSPAFQVKLLRVLQEGEFERVGGDETLKVDVRVIAATHQNVEELIEKGRFREDLYYRLNVIRIDLPPLRDRREDIPLLAREFVREFSEANGKEPMKLSPRVLNALQQYPWRGNIRELRNRVESMVVYSEGKELAMKDLPKELHPDHAEAPGVTLPAGIPMKEVEKEMIKATLLKTNGNRAETARLLQMGRKTLYRKLAEYDLE
jgi:DNA-binding NtrC family response regulator